jgi:hypothetical protein
MQNKSNHTIVDRRDNTDIPLAIAENYELSGENTIIINESATGNSAVTYNNGRVQEEIPINGTIFGDDIDDLNNKISRIYDLKDSGQEVEFLKPYKINNRTNKYYIKSCNFNIESGKDDSCPFTITLTEVRESNVKKVEVNLVGFESAQLMKDVYNSRVGNI